MRKGLNSNHDIIRSLWPANSVLCVFDFRRIEGGSWCKNSVQIFSTLQKNCSTLFWRRQDRFWESVLREASDLVRARPVAEKVETADVGSPETIHPGHVGQRGHKSLAQKLWDCHTKGRVKNCQTWVTFCQIWATHCQTWAKSCQTWATYCQSWATYCQTWGTSWLAYTTDPCYLGFQLCFMINTSEKYERTQRGERAI